jgi:hypothetical protein
LWLSARYLKTKIHAMQKYCLAKIISSLLGLTHWACAQSSPISSINATPQITESDNSTRLISLQWELYSLPLEEAHKLLARFKTDAERYAELVKRANAGEAKLEHLQMIRTRSGQRAKVEAVTVKSYAMEFTPQPQLKTSPSTAVDHAEPVPRVRNEPQPAAANVIPSQFIKMNVGATLEVEPTLQPDGETVDVTVAPEIVHFLGNDPQCPDKSVMQPIFDRQALNTSVTMKSGQWFLLGTQGPPHLSGVEGANKDEVVWLSFLTAEVIRVR